MSSLNLLGPTLKRAVRLDTARKVGRLYLEGIRKRAAAFTQIYSGDVRLLLTWPGFDRNRTHGHAVGVRSLDAKAHCCGRERQP